MHEARLIELDGKLGVSSVGSEAMLDIWMLEDYEKEVWWIKPVVVSDDGEALVDWCEDLVLYDFKHHACRKVIVGNDFRMTNLLYKESLVRHDFFETGLLDSLRI